MKKKFIYLAAGIAMIAVSCKEQGKLEVLAAAEEETYVSDIVEPPQTKRILIEELSGVKCVNCDEGATLLHQMSEENQGQLSIVTLHAGSQFTTPVKEKSKQDFRTVDGEEIVKIIGDGAKPSSAFDRQLLDDPNYKYLLDISKWANGLSRVKTMAPTTPVNIYTKSTYNTQKKTYDIEITLKYTKAVTQKQALHVFLTESDIVDVMETSAGKYDEAFVFNHVFRDAITPVIGRTFLSDVATKEPGRVYIYRTSYKIDDTDSKQSKWNEDNMSVVAFVSTFGEGDDIHVVQVQESKLK